MFKSENKQILFYLLAATIIIAILGFIPRIIPQLSEQIEEKEGPHLVINDQKIFVEVAETTEERKQGLSGRESLAKDEGMLFVFTKPGYYTFWMDGMKFNLDFVFIRGEEVVDLVENVPYPQEGEEPERIISEVDFNKILEVNQGVIEEMDIEVGDKVNFFL